MLTNRSDPISRDLLPGSMRRAGMCFSGRQHSTGRVFPKLFNPEYERFLRERIRHMVADLGVDGFKED